MLNLELSHILTNIAEMNKVGIHQKEKVFPLMRASRTIRDYAGDIGEAYRNKKLKDLPGITPEVFAYIDQYVKTGKVEEYQKLKQKYSEDLVKLIRICGLGFGRMIKVYQILKTDSLASLQEKMSDPRQIEKLTGAKKDSVLDGVMVERIKSSIDFYHSMKGKMPRGYVEHFLKGLMEQIKALGHVSRLEIVGSTRRKKPLIGDIDILVDADFNQDGFKLDPSIKFLSQVLKISHIRSKKSQNIGQANASFVYRSDLGIDIEVIITGSHRYYADLFTTTGSKTHVNSILDILEDNDIDIFNYNLASEEHIYQLAGLQFVPCELREGLKEIEWAQQYKIPRLVALPDIKGDLHVHSPFSDGLISEKDLLDTIKKYNYQYLALTDHSPSNIFGNGLDQKRLAEKLKWFQNLKLDIGDSRILFGAEVDIKEQGRLDYQDQVLKSLEVVVASMHSSFRQGPAQNTQKATAALAHPSVDFLGHPTGIVFGSRAPYSLDMEQIIQQAGKFNKALEINSYFLRLDLNEHYARKAKEAGVLLVINTDSHRPNNLDHMRLGVDIARRAGLSKQDVLNTRDYEGFKQWKKER